MRYVPTACAGQGYIQSEKKCSPIKSRYLFFVILNMVGMISLVACAGKDRSFSSEKRSGSPPKVYTQSPSSIFTNKADLNGTVNPDGLAAIAWFEYGTDPVLSTGIATAGQAMEPDKTPHPVRETIRGLKSYTTYYYRVAASNSFGVRRGDIRTFPTGVYYVAVGDSITNGSQDLDGDEMNYESFLSDFLTDSKGYPNRVGNRGVPGATSADGANVILSTLSKLPWAKYYLIMYGTNDASLPRPVPSGKGLAPGDRGYKGSYKDNLQKIVSAILAAGKIPFLAKVPYAMSPSIDIMRIRDYNAVIDELVAENNIAVSPPDFYTYFQDHKDELADGIHLNVIGYESMAKLWFEALNTYSENMKNNIGQPGLPPPLDIF